MSSLHAGDTEKRELTSDIFVEVRLIKYASTLILLNRHSALVSE